MIREGERSRFVDKCQARIWVQRTRFVMLLNQCLAISLSFGKSDAEHSQTKSPDGADRPLRITQAAALTLFDQLVQENSAKSQDPDGGQAAAAAELAEVLGRVEFAGFVVPSWLLLSGSYDDLHCIKSSWASGRLRAPANSRVETMGKFALRVASFTLCQRQTTLVWRETTKTTTKTGAVVERAHQRARRRVYECRS